VSGIDQADLYDHEIVAIGKVWQYLMDKWARKPNTKTNLQEFAKDANDCFLKLGFVVNVMWENNLIINPATMQPYPIEIEVMGRVPGGSGLGEMVVMPDGTKVELMDHERKRDQVLKSRERGEDFHDKK
jgi:hypothetical protein